MPQELFIPAPIKGMYSDSIFIPPTQGYAQLLRNVSIGPGSIRLRPGTDHEGGIMSPLNGSVVSWHGTGGWLWSDGVIRNSTAGTVYTSALTSRPVYEGRFRDRIYLSYPGQATAAYDGSTWGAFPFTLSTLTSAELAGTTSYRGRWYGWGTDATDGQEYIEVGGLDSITGNTTVFAINRFMQNQNILVCKSFTVEQGVNTGEVFVVFGDKGLVLVFSGDDPGANNWFLSATYQMTNPVSKHGFVEVQGDLIVMGREYIYSMRQLFAGGSQAAQENALTSPVSLLYRGIFAGAFISDYEDNPPFAFYMPQENALVFVCGKASDAMWMGDNAEFGDSYDYRLLQFVYYRQHKAWVLWDVPQLKWPVREDAFGQLYYYVNNLQASFNTGGLQDIQTGEDVVYRYAPLATVDTSYFTSFSVGGQTNYRTTLPHETVWRSTISMERPHRNAHVLGVTPIVRTENATNACIASVGVIGGGADYTKDLLNGRYLAESEVGDAQKSLKSAVETDYAAGITEVKAPYIDVGLQAETFHATLRINQMGEAANSDLLTDDPTMEIFGINVHFEIGGPR